MSTPNRNTSIQSLQRQAASLLLYQQVLTGAEGQAFLELLHALSAPDAQGINCLKAYGKWLRNMAATGKSWQDYIVTRVLRDDNPFTQQVQKTALAALPPALLAAAKQDLQRLQSLYQCSIIELSHWVQEVSGLPHAPVVWNVEIPPIAPFLQARENWDEAIAELGAYYRENGCGIFAEYRALRWQEGQLLGIPHPDEIYLSELAGYEDQKAALLQNTEFLLAGYRALHVLLYGSRGSGKSSLVKALLNKYEKLRLIEVDKDNLKNLPAIIEQLRDRPQKFIIFVDDLSFEEDDDAFKALKVVLEGNLTARSPNVVVYATSNRRHLVREFLADRPRLSQGEEVHAWDTMQEKLSFSDRFGLTLTFAPPNQDSYLEIVRHLASQAGISLTREDLEYRARQWATRHNGRSGRSARQFVDFLQAELLVDR